MEKDEFFIKRIRELANLSYQRDIVTFSDFLNLNEQNILQQTLPKLAYVQVACFGGYEGAERQIAAFVPDALSYRMEEFRDYPISCIQIRPKNARFAEDLSHRDVLGALMHLGIDRCKMGDIAMCDGVCYLFCHTSLAELIAGELIKVRHTTVACSICRPEDFTYQPKVKEIMGTVASIRLDAVMSVAFQSSRSSLLSLIDGGMVFVNGRLITTNAYTLKQGDLISARGEGKFRYVGAEKETKKGRILIRVEKYV